VLWRNVFTLRPPGAIGPSAIPAASRQFKQRRQQRLSEQRERGDGDNESPAGLGRRGKRPAAELNQSKAISPNRLQNLSMLLACVIKTARDGQLSPLAEF